MKNDNSWQLDMLQISQAGPISGQYTMTQYYRNDVVLQLINLVLFYFVSLRPREHLSRIGMGLPGLNHCKYISRG